MNIPLANALPTSWFANTASCWGSAVGESRRSTGKLPARGSAAGTSGITRIAGSSETAWATSGWSCCRLDVRSPDGVAAGQQLPAHHRAESQRHDAREDDRAGESEGEPAEESAGQAGLEADRRVDRREGDRHRDDRTAQLAGRRDRGVERFLSHVE